MKHWTDVLNGFDVQLEHIRINKWGSHTYRYKVTTPTGVVFEGNDLSGSGSDETRILMDLLCFITLRPGDTDDEYFAKYTKQQLAWANSPECDKARVELSDWEVSYQKSRWG